MNKKRIAGLDTFRGWAILLMISYHFTYDLNLFKIISVDMNHTISFLTFRYTIMTMFLLGVGISLALVHKHDIKWTNVKKRMLQLGIASTLVTIATYTQFPHSWVYFGILHFIFIASLLALFFLPYPKITLFTSILIFLGYFTKIFHMHNLFSLLQPLLHLPRYTEDLVPIFPWFAIVLLGIFIVQHNWQEKLFSLKFLNSKNSLNRLLKIMGKHSLLIYLAHQPILFAGFMLFLKL